MVGNPFLPFALRTLAGSAEGSSTGGPSDFAFGERKDASVGGPASPYGLRRGKSVVLSFRSLRAPPSVNERTQSSVMRDPTRPLRPLRLFRIPAVALVPWVALVPFFFLEYFGLTPPILTFSLVRLIMALTEVGGIFSLSLSGLTRTRDRIKDKTISGDKEVVKIIKDIEKSIAEMCPLFA